MAGGGRRRDGADARYDADILAGSEEQAERLRRVAAADERLNDATPDWPNIIEEIESVGRNELRRTESLLIQALRRRLKIMAWLDSRKVPHWREEMILVQMDAARVHPPAMRQHLDMAWISRKARHRFPQQVDACPPQSLPETCPVTLDELLANRERVLHQSACKLTLRFAVMAGLGPATHGFRARYKVVGARPPAGHDDTGQ